MATRFAARPLSGKCVMGKVAGAVLAAAVLGSCVAPARAFMPNGGSTGGLFSWWAQPASAEGPSEIMGEKNECPAAVVSALAKAKFDSLAGACPADASLPFSNEELSAKCTACACQARGVIRAAIAAYPKDGPLITPEQLAMNCAPVFSLNTAMDGVNTKAVVEFLQICDGLPQQVDYATCPGEVQAMSGASQDIQTVDLSREFAAYFKSDLQGLTKEEVIELMGIPQSNVDLADNAGGAVAEIADAMQMVGDFVEVLTAPGALDFASSANDSSMLCPGLATAGACESFQEMNRACPWSCERQRAECDSLSSLSSCANPLFREACPVTCTRLEQAVNELPITLAGATEISQIADGSAIKEHEAHSSLSLEQCMCFKVFQPVCSSTGEMFENICEAECAGVTQFGACKEEDPSLAVAAFAAQSVPTSGAAEACKGVCTREYKPVCTKAGREYDNTCHAECEGVYGARPCEGVGKRMGAEETSSAASASAVIAVAASVAGMCLWL